MIELIIIAILSVSNVVFISVAIASKIKHKKTLETTAQVFIDKAVMTEEIDRLNFIIDNSSDLHDGFIAFLSESREEAFSYISEVQSVIESLQIAMELGNDSMISESYKKLISFLPSENQDVVN